MRVLRWLFQITQQQYISVPLQTAQSPHVTPQPLQRDVGMELGPVPTFSNKKKFNLQFYNYF